MIRFRTLGGLELSDSQGRDLHALLSKPKRLALLAYLASHNHHASRRRDSVVALFWPEMDAAHARGSLRQALRFLRRELGDGVLNGHSEEEIGFEPHSFECDAVTFEQACDAGRLSEALQLYRGDFLDGFYIAGESAELERWIEGERTRLRQMAARAAAELSQDAERKGNLAQAVEAARQGVALDPDDEKGLARLIALLDRSGDRAGALHEYEHFRRRLLELYNITPSPETHVCVEAIRVRSEPFGPPAVQEPVAAATPAGHAVEDITPSKRRRPVAITTALLAGAIAITGALTAVARRGNDAPTVLAVGPFQDSTGADSAKLTAGLAGLLATNLGRLPGLQVVSSARLYEVVGQFRALGDTSVPIARAARQTGATELLEGALYRAPDGTLRLELRRVDLVRGVVRGAYSVQGPQPFALVDSATSQLARAFELRASSLRVADVTTSSLVAHRFYAEGLRIVSQNDPRSAQRLFEAALAEDSTFAMAAYYVAMCRMQLGDGHGMRAPLVRAARLADRTPERERRLIRTTLALVAHEPQGLAMAETLAARYPTEPDGPLLVGQARLMAGDFLGAIPYLRRVVEMDSLAFRGGAVRCRACDALFGISDAYQLADSLVAAEHSLRELLRRQGSPTWLQELAVVLERQGRVEEALATFQRVPRTSSALDAGFFRALVAIRAGDFSHADRLLNDIAQGGAEDLRSSAQWLHAISLRYQGRIAEALTVARRMRRVDMETSREKLPLETSLIAAQALFEMGRPRQAAALFDSLGQLAGDYPDFPARVARHHTWMLTHLVTALAAAGDTARLAALADSMEASGRRSAYGRDPRLHHYARGLLWRARGRLADAERELRAAIYSPNMGYTRTNLELGRVLLERHRPREAIAILAPALRGPLDASNLYVTHTELHELLAGAYDAAGETDSAAVHYRWVVNAWRNADAMFHARLDAARRRLAALQSLVSN